MAVEHLKCVCLVLLKPNKSDWDSNPVVLQMGHEPTIWLWSRLQAPEKTESVDGGIWAPDCVGQCPLY